MVHRIVGPAATCSLVGLWFMAPSILVVPWWVKRIVEERAIKRGVRELIGEVK